MTQSELSAYIKSNILKNIPTSLIQKTTLPEWLELLHDELAKNAEVDSFTFVNKATSVKCYDKLKSTFFVFLMQENKKVVQGLYGKYDDKVNRQVEDVLDLAISVHENGGNLEKLKTAAHSAAHSAYYAAHSAAHSAYYAAHSAAHSAYYAANSAYYAAHYAANSAASSATYKKYYNKLMKLLENS